MDIHFIGVTSSTVRVPFEGRTYGSGEVLTVELDK